MPESAPSPDAYHALPVSERVATILEMFHEQKMPQREIASVLNCHESTISRVINGAVGKSDRRYSGVRESISLDVAVSRIKLVLAQVDRQDRLYVVDVVRSVLVDAP